MLSDLWTMCLRTDIREAISISSCVRVSKLMKSCTVWGETCYLIYTVEDETKFIKA
jgi:hypothetical protein